jgi:hypothetical protein
VPDPCIGLGTCRRTDVLQARMKLRPHGAQPRHESASPRSTAGTCRSAPPPRRRGRRTRPRQRLPTISAHARMPRRRRGCAPSRAGGRRRGSCTDRSAEHSGAASSYGCMSRRPSPRRDAAPRIAPGRRARRRRAGRDGERGRQPAPGRMVRPFMQKPALLPPPRRPARARGGAARPCALADGRAASRARTGCGMSMVRRPAAGSGHGLGQTNGRPRRRRCAATRQETMDHAVRLPPGACKAAGHAPVSHGARPEAS